MPGRSRAAAVLEILIPILLAAAVLAAAAALTPGRLERPDARSPIPLRPGEYRGPSAREFIEHGGRDAWNTSPPSPPGTIDGDVDR